jgi:hypothetical protein
MKYTIYNPANGKIVRQVVITDQDQFISSLGDNQYLQGHWPDDKYYVDQGQPVEKPANPTTQTQQYDWNPDTKVWILNRLFSTVKSREFRNQLLARVDRINPIWYASLTAEQQQELATYRQALLDIPQQADFPQSVEWPPKPQWL